MSSGPFENTKYQSDDGSIHPIRIQPETLVVSGAAPSGAIDSSVSAQVGGSRRKYGLHARGVRLSRVFGSGDTAGRRYNFLPVLTTTTFDGLSKGGTVTYGGNTWTITDKVPEKQR